MIQFNSALPALVQRLWKAIQSFPLIRLHCSLMFISFYSPLAAGCTMLYSKGPFSSLAPSKSLPIVQLCLTAAYTAVYLYFLALDVGFMTCFGNSRDTTGTTFDDM